MPDQLQLIEQLWYFGEIAVHPHTPQAVGCGSLQRTLRYAVAWQLLWSSAFELLVQKFRCFEVCPYVQIYVTLTELLNLPPSCLNPILRVELPPSSIRAPVRESNNWDFKVQCPVMESNFGLIQFKHWLCRRSFRVKIRGSKPPRRLKIVSGGAKFIRHIQKEIWEIKKIKLFKRFTFDLINSS